MRPPPLLLGAGLALWGWCAELLLAALPAALALESARWVGVRLEFEHRDFRRIADLCVWILAAIAGYAVLDVGLPHAVVEVVKLLPLAALPLVLGQAYSTTERLDPVALFRLGDRHDEARPGAGLHVGFPYLLLCLLGAAAANVRSPWFYPLAVALCGWGLWSARGKRYSPLAWLTVLALAAGSGFAGHLALPRAQAWVVGIGMDLFVGSSTDPYRSITDIGQLGELKLSDRILVRVHADEPLPGSFLLHRASYDSYGGGAWRALGAKLEPLAASPDGAGFTLHPGVAPLRALAVYSRLSEGKGVLSLPTGTSRLTDLGVEQLSRNRLGTVRIEGGAAFVRYRAHFRPGAALVSPPGENDLAVPRSEARAIERVWSTLAAPAQSDAEKVERIADHFRRHFAYSLYRSNVKRGQSPIGDFLERTRAGHCEYFATATVLLLRAAGIPARYATGYSVQEYSELEAAYVVRQRHAHAWTRYHLDGAWRDLDTTPAVWVAVEEAQASPLEPLLDWIAWLLFRADRWRSGEGTAAPSPLWLSLLVPLVAYVAWRLRLGERGRARSDAFAAGARASRVRGGDSEFYRIEARLAELGCGRSATEPIGGWLRRLEREGMHPGAIGELRRIVALHYRYRFDPAPIAPATRAELASGVSAWLAALEAGVLARRGHA